MENWTPVSSKSKPDYYLKVPCWFYQFRSTSFRNAWGGKPRLFKMYFILLLGNSNTWSNHDLKNNSMTICRLFDSATYLVKQRKWINWKELKRNNYHNTHFGGLFTLTSLPRFLWHGLQDEVDVGQVADRLQKALNTRRFRLGKVLKTFSAVRALSVELSDEAVDFVSIHTSMSIF